MGNLNAFHKKNINEDLNFDNKGIGKFGFIMSEKYDDSVMYLPKTSDNVNIHHADILRFSVKKLFKNEYDDWFGKYKNLQINEGVFYMDSDEVAFSSFMCSLNSIVFLNTSDELFNSGILFIPDNKDCSSERSLIVNEVLDFLYKNNDGISQVIIVPSLEKVLNNHLPIKAYDLSEFKDLVCKNNKQFS